MSCRSAGLLCGVSQKRRLWGGSQQAYSCQVESGLLDRSPLTSLPSRLTNPLVLFNQVVWGHRIPADGCWWLCGLSCAGHSAGCPEMLLAEAGRWPRITRLLNQSWLPPAHHQLTRSRSPAWFLSSWNETLPSSPAQEKIVVHRQEHVPCSGGTHDVSAQVPWSSKRRLKKSWLPRSQLSPGSAINHLNQDVHPGFSLLLAVFPTAF